MRIAIVLCLLAILTAGCSVLPDGPKNSLYTAQLCLAITCIEADKGVGVWRTPDPNAPSAQREEALTDQRNTALAVMRQANKNLKAVILYVRQRDAWFADANMGGGQ